MDILLQDSTFKQLRDFIYKNSGIYIPDAKKYFLENRLIKRIRDINLTNFEDYLHILRYSCNGDELARLYDVITTNETFFFREPQQFDIFFDFVVPEIIKHKGTSNIRIWSAACSTGEEPYTIIMLFMERKIAGRIEVIASDLSDGVLESAKRATYTSYSIRIIPEPYLKKYFKANGQTYELDPSVKNSVRFMNINLIDEKRMRSMRDMDVIFCRNVLIYFDDSAKRKVVSLLYDTLRPGGFLFIGSSESLHDVTRAFKPVVINKVVVYQKV